MKSMSKRRMIQNMPENLMLVPAIVLLTAEIAALIFLVWAWIKANKEPEVLDGKN